MCKNGWKFFMICSLLLCGCSNEKTSGVAVSDLTENVKDELSLDYQFNDEIISEENDVKDCVEQVESNEIIETKEIKKEEIAVKKDTGSISSVEKVNKSEVKLTEEKENEQVEVKSEVTEKTEIKETETKQEVKEEPVVQLVSSLSDNAVNLINQKRNEQGLCSLSYSSYLGGIAKERAIQIVNDFSHNQFYSDYQSVDYKLGECIAYGYGSALNAVNGWMASGMHRDTLLDPDNVSIAVAYCGEFWVAIVSY